MRDTIKKRARTRCITLIAQWCDKCLKKEKCQKEKGAYSLYFPVRNHTGNDSSSSKNHTGISEEEVIFEICADRPSPRFWTFLQNRGHGKSWCELQAVKITPAALLAAVKITSAMIQAAVKTTPASVKKSLYLKYK